MRKKSHISLSRFLVVNIDKEELLKHRKAFYWGSILPDCVPSFLTRRHTYDETIYILRKEIENLIENPNINNEFNRKFFRKLGVVTHYIADYFTFPHNKTFTGSLKEHCQYEEVLKHSLREHVQTSECKRDRLKETRFETIDELFDYIHEVHERYLLKISTVKKDIHYITNICFEVVDAIIRFIEIQVKERSMIPQIV